MDVIELPSYTRVEKYNIARKHLVPKQLDACGLTGKVTFSQSALYGIIDGYTREAGVRNLEPCPSRGRSSTTAAARSPSPALWAM